MIWLQICAQRKINIFLSYIFFFLLLWNYYLITKVTFELAEFWLMWSLGEWLTSHGCMQACMLSCFSHIWLFVTPWTIAHQAPLFMGFSRQEYWSGLPCPPSEDLPDPGIKPVPLTSPARTDRFLTTSTTTILLCKTGPQHITPIFNSWVTGLLLIFLW